MTTLIQTEKDRTRRHVDVEDRVIYLLWSASSARSQSVAWMSASDVSRSDADASVAQSGRHRTGVSRRATLRSNGRCAWPRQTLPVTMRRAGTNTLGR